MSTPFKLKNKKDFDFGNTGNFDFQKGTGSMGDPVGVTPTEVSKTQNNPVIIPEKSSTPKYTKKKKSIFKDYKKGYYKK